MKASQILFLLIFALISCKHVSEKKIDDNTTPQLEKDLITKATEIHKRVLTVDTHNDINLKNFTNDVNYTQELDNQVNLPKMKKGGLDISWLIVYTGQGELTNEGYANAYKEAIAKFEAIHKLTKEIAPDQIELAVTSEEAKNINKTGKKVAMIGIENGYPIGTDINRVKEFYDLGARYMSLSHNGHSQLCDSNTGEEDNVWLHNGVSELGKEVIAEMNKWGMMIDVSHPSKESMRDMIELSKAPIIASHSSCRALCDHSRNLDDEQLQWLKQNGGVIQTVAFSAYVNTEKNNKFKEATNVILKEVAASKNFEIISWNDYRALDKEAKEAYYSKYSEIKKLAKPKIDEVSKTLDPVNVSDFVDHIDYLVEKIGIEHVGISSDFDGGGGVQGWNHASETLNVTIELVKRGYKEDQIELLWGGNLFRVLDEVQEVAQKIQNL
ncbi:MULTISPECIES: dipeptidase [Flavobacteriaceae]|uniref:Membrane dipeptidase n=2 Tax=Flavobacteriaceae TaxID=49546 RepID=A0A4Y8ASI2_9FLAO|nr:MULTISPECIES: dipeptidase [Flavobacteriaceae]TEW74839.1 membrane dipeptidase [Gramella jeungdoensis]GGK43585.1 peptidase M19 [Lutibacter litoralis]